MMLMVPRTSGDSTRRVPHDIFDTIHKSFTTHLRGPPVLENDYEIRPCWADPQEDPMRNQADAERDASRRLQWDTLSPDA
jgi:hypothetical protein